MKNSESKLISILNILKNENKYLGFKGIGMNIETSEVLYLSVGTAANSN